MLLATYLFAESYFEDFTIYDTLESTYTLTTGSDVEFTCLAFGNNVNVFEFLYIRLDDGAIPDNVQRTSSDATTINGRTTMSITGVTEANAGMYRCVIRNLTSGGDSLTLGTRDFTIQVSGKSLPMTYKICHFLTKIMACKNTLIICKC